MSDPNRSFRGTVSVASIDEDGEPVEQVEEGLNDWLDNFYTLFALLGKDSESKNLTDETGSSSSYETGGASAPFTNGSLNPSIAVGTGTASFNQSDNSLASEDSRIGIDTNSVDLNDRTVTWSATGTASANTDITETGVVFVQLEDDTGSGNNVFVERTVLNSSVSTGSNGDVTITYDMVWP